jgi:hypothetical protein
MTKLSELTGRLPATPGKHFCIAPFQSTRQNAYGRTSPCAFGAGEWRQGQLTPVERWNSTELNNLRSEFIAGNKPAECHRCWDEEAAGKVSLRQRQYEYFPNDYNEFIRTGKWESGPKTAVFKTSNVCNLACRSCGGWDSNTYTKEGQFYAELYNTQVDGTPGNRFIPVLPPKHMNFMQYKDIAQNLEKIDFFGGEPFLNITQLDLLEYLVDQGLSKNITLFYSTNCTNHPTARLKQAWNNFKRVEISVSIDGIKDQFEYMRWPGIWSDAESVLDHILGLKDSLECEIYVMAGLTYSLLNVWYADEIYDWLQKQIGNVYVNMVNSPTYLALHTAPDSVKSAIREKIKHPEILGYLDIKAHDPVAWKQFIIWTKRQDLYRQQSLQQTVPGFFDLIKQDWDSITDLSEENFYGS